MQELELVKSAVYQWTSPVTDNQIYETPAPYPYRIYQNTTSVPTSERKFDVLAYELPPESNFHFGKIHLTYTVTLDAAQSLESTFLMSLALGDKDLNDLFSEPYIFSWEGRVDHVHEVWQTQTIAGNSNANKIPAGQTQKTIRYEYWFANGYSKYFIFRPNNISIYPSGSVQYINGTISNITVEYEQGPQFYKIVPNYPKNVNIKATSNNTFSWNREYDWTAAASYGMPQSSQENFNLRFEDKHTVKYKKNGEIEDETLTVEDGNLYQTIPANTFEVDKYEYKIIQYFIRDSFPLESDLTEFIAIGQNAAPTITNVSNDSIPVVSWSDSNQAGFEVRIKDDMQNIIYDTDVIVSTDTSFKIGKMLNNGTYIVEVRELNIYGIFSEWGSLEFTINTAAVDAPSGIFAYVNNQHGVEISGTPAEYAEKTFVVRRKVGEEEAEIIGIYEGGTFTDYTAEGNTFYEYTLRNYNEGFADGEYIPLQVKIKQYVLQDGRDLSNHIDLTLSDDANYSENWTEERSKILMNVLGRKYPVKEQGEWFNKVKEFKAYIKENDWEKLLDLYYNSDVVYLKANHDFFACDMSIKDEGQYIGGGFLVSFTMTRIEDVKRLEII